MEYLLLICTDGPFTPDEDMEQTTTRGSTRVHGWMVDALLEDLTALAG